MFSSAASAAAGGYIELPGFAGVYVGVREDVLGNVKDERPLTPRPCKVRERKDADMRL